MCVIMTLLPGVNVPFPMLQNAVWNNPHGYGLIVQKGGKLEVTRKFNPTGTEPEEVDQLLRSEDKYIRHIHLRWMTEGGLSIDNVQPFRVYNKKGHEIWFMHNGTLYDYKPGKLVDGTEDPRSDSRIFADEILTPFLNMTSGEYSETVARKSLSHFWGPAIHNRGMLISNKHKPLMFNVKEWKEIKNVDEDGKEIAFLASNDTYFDKVERGFEHERREEVRKKKEAERLSFRQDEKDDSDDKKWGITKLKDICFKPNEFLGEKMGAIMDDYDLWSDDGLAALENLTELEIHTFVKNNPIAAGQLLIYLTGCFARVVDEREEAIEKHDKATKLIATLKQGDDSVYASVG